MKIVRFLLAIPVILALVIVAKMGQYTAVEHLGDTLGFNVASLVGVVPVIALYYWAAAKLPKFKARKAVQ